MRYRALNDAALNDAALNDAGMMTILFERLNTDSIQFQPIVKDLRHYSVLKGEDVIDARLTHVNDKYVRGRVEAVELLQEAKGETTLRFKRGDEVTDVTFIKQEEGPVGILFSETPIVESVPSYVTMNHGTVKGKLLRKVNDVFVNTSTKALEIIKKAKDKPVNLTLSTPPLRKMTPG